MRYTLRSQGGGDAVASCAAQRAAVATPASTGGNEPSLLLDPAAIHDNLDQLALELLWLADSTNELRDVDAANFVELLLSKPSIRAIDRMLQNQRISALGPGLMRTMGLRRIAFADPPPERRASADEMPSDEALQAEAMAESALEEDGAEEEEEPLAVRPVAAAHRETSVARQVQQGKAAELRCAREQAALLWPKLCEGKSEPWTSLSAEFQRINQLGARGGASDLVEVRRPGSCEALAARLHVAAVAEGVGYDVLSADDAGKLVRIEVKSCAARRARAQGSAVPSDAAGLQFYMSEAERRMAALYLKSPAFASGSWRLQMYAPRNGTPSDASVEVDAMEPLDLTELVRSEILQPQGQARAAGQAGAAPMLRPTEWAFAL